MTRTQKFDLTADVVASMLIEAKLGQVKDSKVNPNNFRLQQKNVPPFTPRHILGSMGSFVPGEINDKVFFFGVPGAEKILAEVDKDMVVTLRKRDEVLAGRANGVSVEDILFRLEAGRRVRFTIIGIIAKTRKASRTSN